MADARKWMIWLLLALASIGFLVFISAIIYLIHLQRTVGYEIYWTTYKPLVDSVGQSAVMAIWLAVVSVLMLIVYIKWPPLSRAVK